MESVWGSIALIYSGRFGMEILALGAHAQNEEPNVHGELDLHVVVCVDMCAY